MTDEKQKEILDAFRKWVNKSDYISDATWEAGVSVMQFKTVEKDTCLLKRGRIESNFRFIYSGIVKSEYHEEDASFVSGFFIGPAPCSETVSLIKGVVNGNASLTTITRTTFVEMKMDDIVALVPKYGDFQKIMVSVINQYLFEIMDKMSKLRLRTAEERYHYLMERKPSVMKYAKLEDVASYLNIVPSSLSRIRKANILSGR